MKKKRSKVGKCNICYETKILTWDHVPPKGGIALTSVEIKNIFQHLAGRPDPKFLISQNGVKYRTICSSCNSIIGSRYDSTLNDFNSTLSKYLNSRLVLPNVIFIKTHPIKLIRAILAHRLAAKLSYDDLITDKLLRDFIFNEKAKLPNNVNIFYWIYPYDCTIILRDFGMPAKRGDMSTSTFCDVIKYFPIAFLISDTDKYEGLDCLTKYRDFEIDQEIQLRINLKRIEDYDWPEKVDASNILFTSFETQNGVLARPR